jgi:hypothetical protein
MHTEEERTKGTTGALSSSLPLVGQPEPKQTAAGASICQDHLPHELVVVPTAETRTRPAAVPGAVSLSGTRAIVVPAPKRAPAHADTASNRISAAGIGRYVGTFCSNQAGRRNNQKKLGADYPRRLVRGLTGLFFPVPHALPEAPALGLSLFLTPRRGPVLLLRLPRGPLARLLSTPSTAVALRGLLRMEELLTSLQQTHPPSRPACEMHASGCLLILESVCRTFRKAHGRYSSQKLMPRRGTLNSSPGRSSSRSPTVDQTPRGANTL